MICPQCGGRWKTITVENRLHAVCVDCGFVDRRDGAVSGIPIGPNSPVLGSKEHFAFRELRSEVERLRRENAELRADAERHRWQTMKTAPKDGTAILVLLTGSDIPKPVRWFEAEHMRAKNWAGWYLTWDHYALTAFDGPRYWMPFPDDPDAAIDAARKEPK